MLFKIRIAKRKYFKSEDLWAMHKLRARVFKGRMGWEVPVLSGMEIDGYDAVDATYMLVKERNGQVRGCWRILPTEGPYMLKDSFPELLNGEAAPENERIWELSRFAIEADVNNSFGFANLTIECIKEMMAYGQKHAIEKYVTVTTTAVERLLKRFGVTQSRGSRFEQGMEIPSPVKILIRLYLEGVVKERDLQQARKNTVFIASIAE